MVSAATTTEDHGFTIDENLFDVDWTETGKVYVCQTARSTDPDFDKGTSGATAYSITGIMGVR